MTLPQLRALAAVADEGSFTAGAHSLGISQSELSHTLAALEGDPFLLSDGGCEPLLRLLYDAADIGLRPARRIRDPATLLAMVQQQLGITVVPEITLPLVHHLAVVPVAPAAHRALHLVPANERGLSAAGNVLLDLARQRRHEQPPALDIVASPNRATPCQ